MAESRVVSAVGVAVAHGERDDPRVQRLEAAMRGAVEQAQAEGITDPAAIRARILAARDAVAEAR